MGSGVGGTNHRTRSASRPPDLQQRGRSRIEPGTRDTRRNRSGDDRRCAEARQRNKATLRAHAVGLHYFLPPKTPRLRLRNTERNADSGPAVTENLEVLTDTGSGRRADTSRSGDDRTTSGPNGGSPGYRTATTWATPGHRAQTPEGDGVDDKNKLLAWGRERFGPNDDKK